MQVKNLQRLMKEAQKMQAKMQEQMAELKVDATSGGGMVNVTMDGSKQVLSIQIDPSVVDADDVEMLQDLILAAVNEANRKVDEALQEQLGGLSQGLMPGLGI